MIEIHNMDAFTPIQQIKGALLFITEPFLHPHAKTIIKQDSENKTKLKVQRTPMTQADKDLLAKL